MAIHHLVVSVFGPRSPSEIAQLVIGMIVVAVQRPHAFRAIAHESFKHQLMDEPHISTAEPYSLVSPGVRLRSKYYSTLFTTYTALI